MCNQKTGTIHSSLTIICILCSVFSHYHRNCAEKSSVSVSVSVFPNSGYISNLFSSWLVRSWNIWAVCLLSSQREKRSCIAATQPATSFNMDVNPTGEAAPPSFATMRTCGGASSSDQAFKKCMPRVARLSLCVICFSENVTTSGRRQNKP